MHNISSNQLRNFTHAPFSALFWCKNLAKPSILLQDIAKGGGGGMASVVTLDIHAIAELKEKKVAFTDDKPKYCYTSDDQANYGKN